MNAENKPPPIVTMPNVVKKKPRFDEGESATIDLKPVLANVESPTVDIESKLVDEKLPLNELKPLTSLDVKPLNDLKPLSEMQPRVMLFKQPLDEINTNVLTQNAQKSQPTKTGTETVKKKNQKRKKTAGAANSSTDTDELQNEKIDDDKAEDQLGVVETYADYKPAKLNYGQPHPDPVVETASLSSVPPTDITYKLKIPKKTITKGALSALQLESIIYASQAHAHVLQDGETRAGFLIGMHFLLLIR